MKNPFRSVALIGVGLIGSSLARGLRERSMVDEIRIYTRSPETIERARALLLGDFYTLVPEDAVIGADLVVLCTPLLSYAPIMQRIAPYLDPDTIVTDVGSAKCAAIEAIRPWIPPLCPFYPRPSCRRNREIRSGCRIRRIVSWALGRPDPLER